MSPRAGAHLKAQAKSRARLREAALRYSALRAAAGTHTDTVRVVLRDGTPAVALITVELVPDPTA